VADGRWRQVQPTGCARDVALFKHETEDHEQVQIDAREMILVQHLPEIISLDSCQNQRHAIGRKWSPAWR
jgi:hypothetical protein